MAIYWNWGGVFQIINNDSAFNFVDTMLTWHESEFVESQNILDKNKHIIGSVSIMRDYNQKIYISVLMSDNGKVNRIKKLFEGVVVGVKLTY